MYLPALDGRPAYGCFASGCGAGSARMPEMFLLAYFLFMSQFTFTLHVLISILIWCEKLDSPRPHCRLTSQALASIHQHSPILRSASECVLGSNCVETLMKKFPFYGQAVELRMFGCYPWLLANEFEFRISITQTDVDQQAFPFEFFLRRVYRDIGSRPSPLAGRRWDLTGLWGNFYLDMPLESSDD